MTRAGLDGRDFELEEGGDHPLQLVSVVDVATAASSAAVAPSLGQDVYNVSGGSQISELARLLEKQLPEVQ